MMHKKCQTCKMFEKEIQNKKLEMINLESNFKEHTKHKGFFKICKCHGYILNSKQGYDKHIQSQITSNKKGD